MWVAVARVIEKIRVKFIGLFTGGYFLSANQTKPNGGHFL